MRVAVTLILALGLLIAGGAPTGAAQLAADLPLEVEDALPEVAEASGVSIAQARANIHAKAATAPFLNRVKAQPDVFAAARFNAEDGSYTVYTTLAPDEARGRFGERFNVHFEEVEHSQKELEQITYLAMGISTHFEPLVNLFYADGTTGELVVAGSPKLSRADVQEYATSIGIDLPVRLEVTGPPESQACSNSRSNCTPWRGAVALQKNGIDWCSAAGWAKRNGGRVLITASHCADNVQWKHNGAIVGTEVQSSLWDNEFWDILWLRYAANSDSQRIDVVASEEDTANNWVYKSTTQKDYSLNSVLSIADLDVDDVICMVGMKSGLRCGAVINKDVTSCCFDNPEAQFNDTYNYHRIYAKYTPQGGDSGGAVYGITSTGIQWVGVHSSANPGTGWGLSSRLEYVISDMDLDGWCVVSNC